MIANQREKEALRDLIDMARRFGSDDDYSAEDAARDLQRVSVQLSNSEWRELLYRAERVAWSPR
jgi:hypothetical protein